MKAYRLVAFLFLLVLFGCGKKAYPPPSYPKYSYTPLKSYTVNGKTYYPLPKAEGYVEEGIASWYGPNFHGKRTASGEVYNMYDFTAAHKILPFGTHVLVTNLENGRKTVVRINDRGPFVKGRIIDLSYAAARAIHMDRKGTARVRIEVLGEGRLENDQIVLSYPDFKRGNFYVQVGSFLRYQNAFRLKKKLDRRFSQVLIEPFEMDGRRFYRVQVFVSRNLWEAKKRMSLFTREFPDAFLVAK